MQDNPDRGHFRNNQGAIFEPEKLRNTEGLVIPLGFEFGIARFHLLTLLALLDILKEVLIGGVQVHESLLKGLGIHILEPVVFATMLQVNQLRSGILVAEAVTGLFVMLLTLFEEMIVDKTLAAEVLRERNLLLGGGIQAVFVTAQDGVTI